MPTELNIWFVCGLGLGTVFFGLICIVFLTWLMSLIVRKATKADSAVANNASSKTVAPVNQTIPNRQQLIAAISAVVAEELGTDISAIRILSIKKL